MCLEKGHCLKLAWLGFIGSCCSVTQSLCPTLCDPMNCSPLGFPVLHYLLEFVQTHVHWVSDAIQPPHPPSPPSPRLLLKYEVCVEILHLYLKNSLKLQGKSRQKQSKKNQNFKKFLRSDWHLFDPWFAPSIALGAHHNDSVWGLVPWDPGDSGSPHYLLQPDQGAGFFLSKPLPVHMAIEWIIRWTSTNLLYM